MGGGDMGRGGGKVGEGGIIPGVRKSYNAGRDLDRGWDEARVVTLMFDR
jgi:hypothetical protein